MTAEEVKTVRTIMMTVLATLLGAAVIGLASWTMSAATALERHEVLLEEMRLTRKELHNAIEQIERSVVTREEWARENASTDRRISATEKAVEKVTAAIQKLIESR